jgi:hypothetical protein
LSGLTLDFGNVNSTSVADIVTLTVGGTGSVTFGTATVTDGSGPGTFSMGADTCSGNTLAAGATCTIEIDLNMPGNGNTPSAGTLSVPHNGSGSPAILNLTGN